jgi:hypothetical protein
MATRRAGKPAAKVAASATVVAKGKPLILAAIGARGTGKSAWVQQTLKRLAPSRLAVWDLMQEYGHLQSTSSLGDAIRAMRARRFAIAFRPSRDDEQRAKQFDLWCRACLQAGNLQAVIEELRFVTSASYAPPAWREMTLLGRHEAHRLSIIGTSQRPAQVDKDFLGNCDLIHCGRLTGRADARVAAEVLGVDFRELLMLPDLEFFERTTGASIASRGRLILGARAAPARAPPAPGVAAELADPKGEIPAKAPARSQSQTFSLADLAAPPNTPEPLE